MLAENDVFLIYEADRQLFAYGAGGQYAPLTAEIIDRQMEFSCKSSVLRIHCLTQEGLEHFALHYGAQQKILVLDDCRLIRDFSPLGNLTKLEAVRIEDCRIADKLWDISRNTALKILSIHSARKLVANPVQLRDSKSLEEIRLWGSSIDNKHVLESLGCFSGMQSLRRIDLNDIKLKNHTLELLSTLPNLEEFHFDAGMLTTEEIAWICANYPNIFGDCLRAYTENDAAALSSIRICGHRKPSLHLPQDQKRLDKYISQFKALVIKYQKKLDI